MRNSKNLMFLALGVALLLSVSCRKEVVKQPLSAQDCEEIEGECYVNYKDSIQGMFSVPYHGVTRGENSEVVQMFTRFFDYMANRYDRDAGDFVSFTLAFDQDKGTLSIESAMVFYSRNMYQGLLLPMSLVAVPFITKNSEGKYVATAANHDGHVIYVSCHGSKTEIEPITVDFRDPAKKPANMKTVVDYTVRCFKEGGCAEICRAEVYYR